MHHSSLQSETLAGSARGSGRLSRPLGTNDVDQRSSTTDHQVKHSDDFFPALIGERECCRTDTGLFSSLAYFLGGGGSTDSTSLTGKQTTPEEQEAIKVATSCIEECHIEQLLQETKFLLLDSLNELLKALIYACQSSPDVQKLDPDVAVFSLELLVKVVLQNRDRVTTFWSLVRNQFYSILVNASEKSFFVERTCIGLLRIAARLLRREELVSEVRGVSVNDRRGATFA